MTQDSKTAVRKKTARGNAHGLLARAALVEMAAGYLAVALAVAGCGTQSPGLKAAPDKQASTPPAQTAETKQTEASHAGVILREGDSLRITFPGAPSVSPAAETIRIDGKITLPMVGEVKAAGLTPSELETDLKKKYAKELVSSEVNVTLISSTCPFYVNGAVVRPAKYSSDHPITAFEALMEAGGPNHALANLKDVHIIRLESGRPKTYRLNLKPILQGKSVEPFYLKPYDTVFVPEKFSWF